MFDASADSFDQGRKDVNIVIRPERHIHEAVIFPEHHPPVKASTRIISYLTTSLESRSMGWRFHRS